MSKTFPQESSEAFLNLKKSALPRTKKLHQRVITECFEKHFAKKTWFGLASQKKKLFGTLEPLLNKPLGFITKLLEKTVRRQSLAK